MNLGVTLEIKGPVSKAVGGFLPDDDLLRDTFESVVSYVSEQISTGAGSFGDIISAYSKTVIAEWYVGEAPPGLNFSNGVCCSGTKVQCTTWKAYWIDVAAAYSPLDFKNKYGHWPRIWCKENGNTYQAGEIQGPCEDGLGRAGGYVGWDKFRDLVAFALASFKHNFEALLGAFANRPKLPCNKKWYLPNLVYAPAVEDLEKKWSAKIVAPPVAVPPASYQFDVFPTPLLVLKVGTKCPKSTEAYIEFWDSKKQDLVQPQKVTFPQGESETIFYLKSLLPSISKGYFNINPVNSDMCVSYVDVVFPPVL